MKMLKKGNAKLKPKIAVNSANHSAARLRFQSTVVSVGLLFLLSASVEDLDDAVGGDG